LFLKNQGKYQLNYQLLAIDCSRRWLENRDIISCFIFFICSQFPEELVTYGGNGQVFSNWAQV